MATLIAPNRWRPRLRLVALYAVILVAIGALAAYAFLAVLNQPLTASSTFQTVPGSRFGSWTMSLAQQCQ